MDRRFSGGQLWFFKCYLAGAPPIVSPLLILCSGLAPARYIGSVHYDEGVETEISLSWHWFAHFPLFGIWCDLCTVKLFKSHCLMPSSHLPRTPCDKFVYDFPCDFGGIVGGYGLRHMCSHCLRASCYFFYAGETRGKSVHRLCGNCTMSV